MKLQTLGYLSLATAYAVLAEDVSKNPCKNDLVTPEGQTECIEYLTKRVNRFDRGKFTGKIKAHIGQIVTGLLTELLENPELLTNLLSVGQDFVLGGDIPSVGEVGGILDGWGTSVGWGWGSDSGSDPTTESDENMTDKSSITNETAESCDNEFWQDGAPYGPALYETSVGFTSDDNQFGNDAFQECVRKVKLYEPDANGATATPYGPAGTYACLAQFNMVTVYTTDMGLFGRKTIMFCDSESDESETFYEW